MSFLVDRRDILEWSDEVRAAYDLPRILRSLVYNDNRTITRLDMRSSEGARLPGYDGVVEALVPSTLVPAGQSVWEIGVEIRPSAKATKDFNKRTKDPGLVVPAETTYVAVSSRSWPTRARWVAERRAEGVWRDVRAYDVDDLLSAFDRDTPSTILFLDLVNRRGSGVTTLNHWWSGYRASFDVSLTPEFVLAGRAHEKVQLETWMANGLRTVNVRAQSREDGRAFIASALETEFSVGLNPVVCDDTEILRELLARSRQALVIVTTIESSLLPALGAHRVIEISTSGRCAIELPRQSARELTEILRTGGADHDDAERYGAAARRSLYRYRLVNNKAMHPLWIREFEDRQFRLLWLLGGWERDNADVESLLQTAFGLSVDEAAEKVSRDVNSADPVFSYVGGVWRVTAPLESARYFAERPDLVPGDLAVLRDLSLLVLGETDPALELPEKDRWLADVRGKSRRYGKRIRRSVATTLAVLASECGSEPLQGGLNVQDWADRLVQEIFEGWADPLTKWASLDDVLTVLVEAAPDVVLERIDLDLLRNRENLCALSQPDQSPILWGGSSRLTTILWSLQSLLWSPEHCERAVDVARDLASGIVEGKSSPTAMGVFREALWPPMPQSALGASGRIAAIERSVRAAPDVAKRAIEDTITKNHGFVTVHRTHFRPWNAEKQHLTWADVYGLYEVMINGAITLAVQFPELWVTLADAVDKVGARGFEQIASALEALPRSDPIGVQIWQAMQGQLRRHRKHRDSDWALPDAYLERAEAAVKHLTPSLARNREEWLFGDRFGLGLSSDDILGADSVLKKLQASAVTEIYAEEGLQGLLVLADAHPHNAWSVGAAFAEVNRSADLASMLPLLRSDSRIVVDLARGYLFNSTGAGGVDLLQQAQSVADDALLCARLLLLHSDMHEASGHAERLGRDVEEVFWREFGVFGRGAEFPHGEMVVRKCLDHGFGAKALDALALYGNTLTPENRAKLVVEGLFLILARSSIDGVSLPSMYEFRELLGFVRDDPSIDMTTVCRLEWAYFPLLEFDDDEPLAIEVAASEDAENFVYLFGLAYGVDLLSSDNHGTGKAEADVAFQVLHRMRYTLGRNQQGSDMAELASWIESVRLLVTTPGGVEQAMYLIGGILGRVKSPGGDPYPSPAIVDVLERSIGVEMLLGFRTAVFNGRGVTWRGHGGGQERELAERYEAVSRGLRESAPRTSRMFGVLARGYRMDGVREDERDQRIEDGIDLW